MKKTLTALAATLALGAVPALAADADMSITFDNTVNVQPADGSDTINILYNEDGSYSSSAGDSGTWALEGEQLCTTPAEAEKSCVDVEWGHAVGESWQNEAGDTITIVEGRE